MSEQKKNKTGVWALCVKLGGKMLPYLGKLLKLTKVLKFGLAAVSLAAYSYMFTWKFAVLIMIALAWHESGHVWAMKRMGIKTKGFYFLPFLGGAAIAEEKYKTYGQNAFVSLMGPVWGFVLATASVAVYYATGNPLFAAAGGWMAMINLFNLFPVNPLDGGQVVKTIAFSIHKTAGFVFLILSLMASTVLMFTFRAGLFGFLTAVGVLDVLYEYYNRKRIQNRVDNYLEKAEFFSGQAADDTVHGMKRMARINTEHAEFFRGAVIEIQKTIPAKMNRNQLIMSIVAYAGLVIMLICIVKLMGHVPGGDIASEFLADK